MQRIRGGEKGIAYAKDKQPENIKQIVIYDDYLTYVANVCICFYIWDVSFCLLSGE